MNGGDNICSYVRHRRYPSGQCTALATESCLFKSCSGHIYHLPAVMKEKVFFFTHKQSLPQDDEYTQKTIKTLLGFNILTCTRCLPLLKDQKQTEGYSFFQT